MLLATLSIVIDLLQTEITTLEEMRPADEEEAAQRDARLKELRAALADVSI